jgi:hydrophobe/amphiphile efflux-3 (HAE3) family protein
VNLLFARLVGWAVARRGAVVAATLFVTLLGTIAALRLESDAETDTLFDTGSESFAATERLHSLFGDEAIPVLVRGDLERIVLTENLGQLLRLEGCLSGNLPSEGRPPAPVCREIADSEAVRAVYGPATFLNQSAIQAERLLTERAQQVIAEAQAAAAAAVAAAREDGVTDPEALRTIELTAAQEIIQNFQGELTQIAVETGQQGIPRIDDPLFVSAVVFDSRLPEGTPRQDLNSLFPSENAALITVRLEPDLSADERHDAIGLIRTAIADKRFQLDDAEYVVSGVPVVIEELADEFRGEVLVLLAAALAVMALVLALVFEPPLRLLPLALALCATAITFGVLSVTGGSLTMASIAVLPVLIGLAVDYSIQFQARYREALEAGDAPAVAARSAASRGGPVIGAAALATAVGIAVLMLSPIPMVRGFGVLLVVGIAAALLVALTSGFAVLVGAGSGWGGGSRMRAASERIGRRFAGARAAGARLSRRGSTRALALAIARPGRVLVVSVVLAVGGWVASTQTEVSSDLRELVPGSVLSDAGVDQLQAESGVSGELNVVVDARDITDPEVVSWMGDLKRRILAAGGFDGRHPSCEAARICPYVFVTDILGREEPTRESVKSLLQALPPYFTQAFIARKESTDPEAAPEFRNTANIAFGIRVMPLDEQKELIDAIRAEINPQGIANDPPRGVTATVAGIPVLAADANAELSNSRYWLTLAGLGAVAIVLLLLYRSFQRVLVPLIPVVLATGWSALVIWVMQIPLNPMSATLGALVIAIATEFSVILSARFREERERGLSVGEALRTTYERTGAAVVASGVTAIAGFAVLPIADPIERIFGGRAIPMLTEFGLVTVVDLAVALLGVMLVLPAALVWIESRAQVPGLEPSPAGEAGG